jgi:hypothetical protein
MSSKNCEKFVEKYDKIQRKRNNDLVMYSLEGLNSLMKLKKEEIDGNTHNKFNLIETKYYVKINLFNIKDYEIVIDKKKELGLTTKVENERLKFYKNDLINNKKIIKKLKMKISNPPKPITSEEREKIIEDIDIIIKGFVMFHDLYKNGIQLISKETIRDMYCNLTCKDTIFEDGLKLSDGFKKKTVRNLQNKFNKTLKKKELKQTIKATLNDFEENKQKLFLGKNSIIKDGFYNKIDKKYIERMKKMGIQSGCFEPKFQFDVVLYSM